MRAFVNGTIGPPFRSEGVLVSGDRIAAVGPDEEIRASARSRGAEIVDLEGGTLLPAFQDAHVHLYLNGQQQTRLDLGGARSVAEIGRAVRAFAARQTEPVLYAFGVDEWELDEKRLPTREELTALVPDRPLVLFRVCRHVAVLNDAAMDRVPESFAGADRTSGRLEEQSLFRIEKEVFVPSLEDRMRWIRLGEQRAFSLGITTVHEIKGAGVADAYRALATAGDLRMRVFYFLYGSWDDALRMREEWRRRSRPPLHFGGFKIFADGTIGGETAAVHEPYASGGRGELLWSDDRLRALFEKAAGAGMPVMCHAIGDRAIDQLVAARLAVPGDIPCLRMEHAEMLREESVPDLLRGNWNVCMQPNFVQWQGEGGPYESSLGERVRSMNRWRSWADAGVPVAFGSDGMPMDPVYGLESAVRGPVRSERMSWEDAFRRYTSACEDFVPGGGDAGRIERGKRADLNWVRVPAAEIETMKTDDIVLTIAGGEVVHER